jgi:hypothetical protein
MSRRISLPSPPMAVACLALGVALGGTSYAAVKIPPKSVGREQIRNGAVGIAAIRKDAVDSSKVKDGTLQARDLRKGVLPAAPKPGTSVVRQQSGAPVPAGAVGAVSAACQPGERATGGGGGFAGPPLTADNVVDSIPVGDEPTPLRWRISLFNGGTAPRTPVAYVLCATG